ncbi:chromosome segregation protein SMC, primarily archaeal type [Thermoplasmatales archaeon BRNA1]|nr:chromosome segregation protein SMC, primarily archaeal type [Thermoplasmatales archaeon BRNA1]
MYLKQIELENFKSFGGKVTIPMMDGYMAITGPNGSGKSNIGDAIMFVLGPKSPKAVRAGRIPDLVFSGGANKAKADYMKATLVFDNTDRVMPWNADEVRLTRYVKLKGEDKSDYTSYFFINDTKATLGDFDTLLSKARISADGYNIVQQGDVTNIVRMGSVERRRILDGISGIASFDSDIDKAENEKEEATANLDRISIIRGEKESQLKSLEKDREQAKIYLEQKEKLDIAKAQLVVRQRDNEKATLDGINTYVARLQNDVDELAKKKAAKRLEADENDRAIEAKEKEIEDHTGPEYRQVKNDVEETKVKVATERERKADALLEAEDQKNYRQELADDIDANRGQYSEVAQNIADLQSQLDSITAEKKAAQKQAEDLGRETASHGGEMTQIQKRIEELDRAIDQFGAEDQQAKADAASAVSVSETAEIALANAESAVEAAKFEVKDAEYNLAEVKRAAGPDDAEELGKQVFAFKQKEASLEKQEEDLRAIAEKKNAEFNRLNAEKRASDAANSGSEALSQILAQRDSGQISGIIGAVSELATVDPGYETALSVAAGNKMRAVVVKDDDVAATCIKFLKDNRLGRVTFLPINKMMPGKPRAKAIMVLKQTEGYATDFLQYKPEYENVFWYVLGDTLVDSSIDHARSIMGGIRIVTKAGELIEASGAMTGGTLSTKNIPKFGASSQGELSRAAEELSKANAALEGVRAELRAIRDQIRETDDLMRRANSSNAENRGKVAAAEASLNAAKKALAKAEEDLARMRKSTAEATETVNTRQANAAVIAEKLENMRNERTAARERLAAIAPADLQERIEKARNAVYELTQKENDLLSQIGGARAELSGLDKQKEALDDQVSKTDKAIAEAEAEAGQHQKAMDQLDIELAAKKKILSDMESGVEDLKSARDALVERKYKLEGEVDKAQGDIETKNGILQSQQAQVLIHQQTLQGFEEEIKQITVEILEPIPAEETLKRTIRTCEGTIGELGNINLRAIEDYDVRRAELEELLGEVARLNKQIDELNKLTDELTAKKKGLFMEAYTAVNDNFKRIYTQLSGGGEGFMDLDNPEDPFAGGLQINAKPRNGKLLRLESLSGGEKSLTALSFIFAIQEYQPSPFYVLDEVDMFLDAVNSEMVAKRVKESSRKAQFIQVSLRKVALTVADHLIGVTRPPSGISKIIMQPDISEVSKYEEEALRRQKEQQDSEVQQ